MPFIDTPNICMHYETGGQGRKILLLLHGNFASWRWWQPALKHLSGHYRIFAPDMRGCGDSEHPKDGYNIAQHVNDLKQFVDALQLRRLHLVGHSLGGCVALEFALAHSAYVKSLTLVAPAPAEGQSVLRKMHGGNGFMANPDTVRRTFLWFEVWGLNRKIMDVALNKMIPTHTSDIDFKRLVDDAVHMSTDAVVGHMRSLGEWDVRAQLSRLKLPVLVMGGENDHMIAAPGLQNLAANLPNGRAIIWPKVGHSPQLERPVRFTKILVTFIEMHSASPIKKFRRVITALPRFFSKPAAIWTKKADPSAPSLRAAAKKFV